VSQNMQDLLYKSLACQLGKCRSSDVGKSILKAAGTPMMRPFPEANSVARLTLLPGLPSMTSTEGMLSPT
jgi:hypothetical protein